VAFSPNGKHLSVMATATNQDVLPFYILRFLRNILIRLEVNYRAVEGPSSFVGNRIWRHVSSGRVNVGPVWKKEERVSAYRRHTPTQFVRRIVELP
jgi:hypothetical protein